MKPIILLAMMMIATCNVQQPDYTSSFQVDYYFETSNPHWDPAQIEAQELGFATMLSTVIPEYSMAKIRNSLKDVEVHVVPDKFQCESSPTGWCNGIQDGATLFVRDFGCPSASALTHEMAHRIQEVAKGIIDYQHEEQPLWTIADASYRGGQPCPE